MARHGPDVFTPKRLLDEEGRPLIDIAFAAIEREWGTIEGYLEVELGIGQTERIRLQDRLLESD